MMSKFPHNRFYISVASINKKRSNKLYNQQKNACQTFDQQSQPPQADGLT